MRRHLLLVASVMGAVVLTAQLNPWRGLSVFKPTGYVNESNAAFYGMVSAASLAANTGFFNRIEGAATSQFGATPTTAALPSIIVSRTSHSPPSAFSNLGQALYWASTSVTFNAGGTVVVDGMVEQAPSPMWVIPMLNTNISVVGTNSGGAFADITALANGQTLITAYVRDWTFRNLTVRVRDTAGASKNHSLMSVGGTNTTIEDCFIYAEGTNSNASGVLQLNWGTNCVVRRTTLIAIGPLVTGLGGWGCRYCSFEDVLAEGERLWMNTGHTSEISNSFRNCTFRDTTNVLQMLVNIDSGTRFDGCQFIGGLPSLSGSSVTVYGNGNRWSSISGVTFSGQDNFAFAPSEVWGSGRGGVVVPRSIPPTNAPTVWWATFFIPQDSRTNLYYDFTLKASTNGFDYWDGLALASAPPAWVPFVWTTLSPDLDDEPPAESFSTNWYPLVVFDCDVTAYEPDVDPRAQFAQERIADASGSIYELHQTVMGDDSPPMGWTVYLRQTGAWFDPGNRLQWVYKLQGATMEGPWLSVEPIWTSHDPRPRRIRYLDTDGISQNEVYVFGAQHSQP